MAIRLESPFTGPPETRWNAAAARLPILACLVLILAASMSHVAGAFGAYERADAWRWWGWLAAVGIDATIAVLMWRLMSGRRLGGNRWALVGVLLASAVSAQANLAHALTVAVERGIGVGVLGPWVGSPAWQVLGVLTVSVTLPVFVGVLAAVAHGDAESAAPDLAKPAALAKLAKPAKSDESPPEMAFGHGAKRRGKLAALAASGRLPTNNADRLSLAVAFVAANGLRPDAVIAAETGVPRSTVGYWRRSGLLGQSDADASAPPKWPFHGDRNGAAL